MSIQLLQSFIIHPQLQKDETERYDRYLADFHKGPIAIISTKILKTTLEEAPAEIEPAESRTNQAKIPVTTVRRVGSGAKS